MCPQQTLDFLEPLFIFTKMANRYVSQNLRDAVLKRDNSRCRYCGEDVSEKYHIDHVYPLSKGGETSFGNLVVSCPRCNLAKSDKVGIWPSRVIEIEKEIIKKVEKRTIVEVEKETIVEIEKDVIVEVRQIRYFPIYLSFIVILISTIAGSAAILLSNFFLLEILKTVFTYSTFGLIFGLGSLIGLSINAK